MSNGADETAVRAAASDYIEGWYDGDAGRMERALHPELVKRCRGIEGDDPDALETLTQREMVDATAQGEGRDDQRDRAGVDQLLRALLPLAADPASQKDQRVSRSLGLLEVQ